MPQKVEITVAYEDELVLQLDPAAKGVDWAEANKHWLFMHYSLAGGDGHDAEMARVFASTAALIEAKAGTPWECFATAIIWERG